jgi:hypothetical protein
MRSNASVPIVSFGPASASVSFRRAVSCPAPPTTTVTVTASTHQALYVYARISSTCGLVESSPSLPRSGIVSCSLAAATSALAAPLHSAAAGSFHCAPAAASRCSRPRPAATAAGLDLSAAPAAAPVPPSHMFASQLGTASPFPTQSAALLHHAQSVGTAITRADGSTRKHAVQPQPQAVSKKLGPKCGARQLVRAAAAAVAAVVLLCSVAGAAARHVAVSDSQKAWSIANLRQARGCLAATSLPNEGVAMFAGGSEFCTCHCF